LKEHKLPTIGVPLRVYLYLDREGIESLYAQTTDRIEVEFATTKSKEGRGGTKLRVGLGNLLVSLLGIKEASTEMTLETVRGQIESAKTQLSIEHKLQRLIEFLRVKDESFTELNEAVQAAELGQRVFVQIDIHFDSPDFYPTGGGHHAVNASEALIFRINDRYDPSDSYFKKPRFNLFMHASLKKIPGMSDGIGFTSHLALFLRGREGKDIRLGVFGYLVRLNATDFQLKPYAIWLPDGPRSL
jgi:hypothetical protein